MIMPHTPRHSARLATKVAESPLNFRNPVQSRPPLPQRANVLPDEMGDSLQATPIEPGSCHDGIPLASSSSSQKGLRHTTSIPHRATGLATSNTPSGAATAPAEHLLDDHPSRHQSNMNPTTHRKTGRAITLTPPSGHHLFPSTGALPASPPPRTPADILTFPLCTRAPTATRSLPVANRIVLTLHPSARTFTTIVAPPTTKQEAFHVFLALAAHFSPDDLRAAIEDL